ncbi:hypothetical protein NDU88_003121 [Pleurodeles waltl]|uniref:Uncharacterized protein n=1 Tax=Pleurodeles waltl TaxID=8319 RepID=A0AAV7UXJ3_PLEWA|nr:hypothetical protein NDU88_003121 [Pleurodeles waltl]
MQLPQIGEALLRRAGPAASQTRPAAVIVLAPRWMLSTCVLHLFFNLMCFREGSLQEAEPLSEASLGALWGPRAGAGWPLVRRALANHVLCLRGAVPFSAGPGAPAHESRTQ